MSDNEKKICKRCKQEKEILNQELCVSCDNIVKKMWKDFFTDAEKDFLRRTNQEYL